MTRLQFFLCIFVILVLGLVGIGEVMEGHALSALRAGQAELGERISELILNQDDLSRRIDNLAAALGQPVIETGLASYYNYPFHGRRTANGEIFDKESQTAAHKTARFGTWALVENLLNGARTMVRINDRGPFIDGRIIDLSEKGARDLGMIHAGVVPVRIFLITSAIPIARPGIGD
jgi:hypothetical protein